MVELRKWVLKLDSNLIDSESHKLRNPQRQNRGNELWLAIMKLSTSEKLIYNSNSARNSGLEEWDPTSLSTPEFPSSSLSLSFTQSEYFESYWTDGFEAK